jgi:hypothetical protein
MEESKNNKNKKDKDKEEEDFVMDGPSNNQFGQLLNGIIPQNNDMEKLKKTLTKMKNNNELNNLQFLNGKLVLKK